MAFLLTAIKMEPLDLNNVSYKGNINNMNKRNTIMALQV